MGDVEEGRVWIRDVGRSGFPKNNHSISGKSLAP
jgi:hypothetical protein